MEAFPFHHPFILDQSLSFLNPATVTATATASFHDDQVLQPHDHNGFIEVSTGHSNQVSIGNNNLQSSDSSMSSMVAYDHHFETKMPTTNFSFKSSQSNGSMPKKSCKRSRKAKINMNDEEEKNKRKMKDCKEDGQIGYIFVRARRGQATDSHSLAERVRREKISERMKALQAIVPGCDKITGKALMLDEVINYVQTLQKEIEILSLKLASVNSMCESGEDVDAYMLKPHHQDLITDQQHLLSFQEQYHVSSTMVSENNGDILSDVEELKSDDPFALINNFGSFYY